MDIEKELIDLNKKLRDTFIKYRGYSNTRSNKKKETIPKKKDDIVWGILRRLYIIEDELKGADSTIEHSEKGKNIDTIDYKIKNEVATISHIPHLFLISFIIAVILIIVFWTKKFFLNLLLIIGMPIVMIIIMSFVEQFVINHCQGIVFTFYKKFKKDDYEDRKEKEIKKLDEQIEKANMLIDELTDLQDGYMNVLYEMYDQIYGDDEEAMNDDYKQKNFRIIQEEPSVSLYLFNSNDII